LANIRSGASTLLLPPGVRMAERAVGDCCTERYYGRADASTRRAVGKGLCLMLVIQARQAAWVKAMIGPPRSTDLLSSIASSCAAASTQAPPSHQLLLRHSEFLPRPDPKTPSQGGDR
jgi:hypothetical protein